MTTSQKSRAPGIAALAWLVALATWILMDVANAVWGWTPAYVLVSLAVPTAGALLVVAQVRLARTSGGLGWLASAGIGVTALGAAAGVVAWAIAVWATLITIGMLTFGVAMLGRGRVPRAPGLAFTFAFLPTALAGLAGLADNWMSVPLAVSAGLLALGLRGLGGWMSTAEVHQP